MNMYFTEETKELESIFKAIIRTILNLFGDKKIFMSKLSLCELHVKNSTTSSDAKVMFERYGYAICMRVNSEDPLSYISFQFAHELCHLMCMPFNSSPFNSFNRSDNSFAITTLTRKSGKIVYGATFEEAFCNEIALLAISSIFPFLKYDDKYISIKKSITFVEDIVESFSLDTYTIWDEYIEGTSFPKNVFLFGIASGDISLAIYYFDKLMGEGQWQSMMQNIYWYFATNDLEERKSIYRFIKNKVSVFKSKYQQTDYFLTAV